MATAEKPSDNVRKQAEEVSGASRAAPDIGRISIGAWLRSMLAIASCVFRHPLSITYVDLSTGEAVQVGD
jgi:hypothetical protein